MIARTKRPFPISSEAFRHLPFRVGQLPRVAARRDRLIDRRAREGLVRDDERIQHARNLGRRVLDLRELVGGLPLFVEDLLPLVRQVRVIKPELRIKAVFDFLDGLLDLPVCPPVAGRRVGTREARASVSIRASSRARDTAARGTVASHPSRGGN